MEIVKYFEYFWNRKNIYVFLVKVSKYISGKLLFVFIVIGYSLLKLFFGNLDFLEYVVFCFNVSIDFGF